MCRFCPHMGMRNRCAGWQTWLSVGDWISIVQTPGPCASRWLWSSGVPSTQPKAAVSPKTYRLTSKPIVKPFIHTVCLLAPPVKSNPMTGFWIL